MSFQTTGYENDNLSALLSEAQDNQLMGHIGQSSYDVSGLTYDEMLNYAPAGMTQSLPNPASGMGESQSMNPVFYLLAAVALGYIFLNKERVFGALR